MEQLMPRQDLVEADLTCLMCGRLIGQLSGLLVRDVRGQGGVPSTVRWSSFRPAGGPGSTVLCTSDQRLRCLDCGGAAVMEAISVSAARESVPVDHACPIHRDRMQGRGRRPRGCLCNAVQAAA